MSFNEVRYLKFIKNLKSEVDDLKKIEFSNVDLNFDEDAIHDNVDGEINVIAEKTTLADGDLVLIEDSEASYAKKKINATLFSEDAIHDNVPDEVNQITEKTTLVNDDLFLIEDSESVPQWQKKRVRANTSTNQQAISNDISIFLNIGGLRMFIPCSSVDEDGSIYDISGQGRHLTRHDTNAIVAGGTGAIIALYNNSCFYRPMEAGLAMSGTEDYQFVPHNGIAMGAWVRFLDPAGTNRERIITNGSGVAGDYSYILDRNTDGTARFTISNGTITDTQAGPIIEDDGWHYVAGRYDYNEYITVQLDDTLYTSAVPVGFGLLNTSLTTYDFAVGASRTVGGVLTYGAKAYMSKIWLSSGYVSDEMMVYLYEATKGAHQ